MSIALTLLLGKSKTKKKIPGSAWYLLDSKISTTRNHLSCHLHITLPPTRKRVSFSITNLLTIKHAKVVKGSKRHISSQFPIRAPALMIKFVKFPYRGFILRADQPAVWCQLPPQKLCCAIQSTHLSIRHGFYARSAGLGPKHSRRSAPFYGMRVNREKALSTKEKQMSRALVGGGRTWWCSCLCGCCEGSVSNRVVTDFGESEAGVKLHRLKNDQWIF